LFLVAVLLPSVVLVVLGLRMIGQEQELAEQRVADDRRRAVTDIGDVLLAELDRIRLETLTDLRDSPSNLRVDAYPAVRLVARIENGAVIPPWDESHAIRAARASLAAARMTRNSALASAPTSLASVSAPRGPSTRMSHRPRRARAPTV
jgi:hypothetical protein